MHFEQKIVHLRVWNTKRANLWHLQVTVWIEEIMQKSRLNNLYALRLITTKVFGSHGKRWIFLSNSNPKFDPKYFPWFWQLFYSQKMSKRGISNWHIIVSRFFFRVRWHKSQIMGYSSQRLYFHLQRPQWDRYLPQIQPRWPMGGLWWRRRCSQGQYIRTLRSPFHYLFIANKVI